MQVTDQFIITGNCATLSGMKEHDENMYMLLYMLSVLRERQSSWQLTAEEREKTRQGIQALQAAVDALSVQVYA